MKQLNIITPFLAVILLIICITGVSQEESNTPINTDRPTQSIAPYTLPQGLFQLETGVIAVDRKDDLYNWEKWSIATTLLRYGVYDNFEVRVESSYELQYITPKTNSTDSTLQGVGPITASFKVALAEEKGVRPKMAISGSITFRHIGDQVFAPTYSYPVGLFLASHTLTKKLSLLYNIGFAYSGESADGFFVYSGLLGYQITDRLWSFAEVYGDFDHGDKPNHRVSGGFTYLIANNFQVDLSAGYGLDSQVKRFQLNAGLAWRIPH